MIDKIWIYSLCPTWSFIINVLFWAFHPHKIMPTLQKIKEVETRVSTIKDIKKELKKLSWVSDHFKDWTPWLITFVCRGYKDDCDGAAIFGRFLFSCIGIKSKIYYLRGPGSGHAVCVTALGNWMVSNNRLIALDGPKDILKHFNGNYIRIL